ncbi:MAG: 3-deoxy-8-phosphooctulonate synthase [Candidatus Neomarinimicrobiota bacterium]
MTRILIKDIQVGERLPLVFILGPCVIESRDHALQMAEKLKILAEKLGFPLIYKSSFDKANRSDINSYRGPGLDEGLKILAEVKKQFDLPILTDIHEPFQAEIAAKVVDVLQIPAFLCRQTDLILAIARTGKVVNVKKGQFVAPHDIIQIVRKIESVGNHSILLTDRGTCFGYGGLVSDVRAVPIMQKTGYPVIYDATHSAQVPGGNVTGGAREFIPHLSRAMVAAGCDGLFMEVHDNVDQARSDRATQYPLDKLPELIKQLMELGGLVR